MVDKKRLRWPTSPKPHAEWCNVSSVDLDGQELVPGACEFNGIALEITTLKARVTDGLLNLWIIAYKSNGTLSEWELSISSAYPWCVMWSMAGVMPKLGEKASDD